MKDHYQLYKKIVIFVCFRSSVTAQNGVAKSDSESLCVCSHWSNSGQTRLP